MMSIALPNISTNGKPCVYTQMGVLADMYDTWVGVIAHIVVVTDVVPSPNFLYLLVEYKNIMLCLTTANMFIRSKYYNMIES